MMTTMDNLSDRLRECVIETLSLIADEEAQRSYQRRVPDVAVPGELFNQWEDCYFPKSDQFRAAFSTSDLEALRRFDSVVQRVADATPQVLPPLEAFIRTSPWQQLAGAASQALLALQMNEAATPAD